MKRIYINYFGPIDYNIVSQLQSLITQVRGQHNPEELYFLLSSGGGSVDAGITFYNFLRNLPEKIIMHNVGSIDSIATVIFMAGDERYASPHTSFLYHGVQVNLPKTQCSLSFLKEMVSNLEGDQLKISGIIAEKSSMSSQELEQMFINGEKKDLDHALNNNVISEIKVPDITKSDAVINVNIK